MSRFLVTFEIEDELRPSLIEQLKRLGSWARITTNTWCVMSDDKNTVIIRDALKEAVGDNGRLFVVNITDSAWASYCIPKEVTDWLKDNC